MNFRVVFQQDWHKSKLIPGHEFLGYIKILPITEKKKKKIDPFKKNKEPTIKPFIIYEDQKGMDFPFEEIVKKT